MKTYLEGLKWDGAPRLDTLFTDYLGVEDSVYTRAVTRKTLVGAVARVMTPGCKFDYMPILLGRQGCGKSTMIRKLAVNDDWFSDSLVTFDGAKAFEALMGKWLIEIPEMNTFDRTTMNQAKAFITKQGDFFRAAYAEFPEERSRQCIFIGTTNDPDCLRDNTGGRRYWPLDTDAVPRTKNLFTDLAAERDQVWAEAFFRWQLGEPLYLPREIEAIAAERQEEHRSQHPWESVIQEFVDKELPLDWVDWPLDKRMLYWQGLVSGELQTHPRRVVCAREVWQEALGLPLAQLDRRKAGEITDILGSLRGWVRHTTGRFGPIYGTQKCFLRVN